MTYTTVQPNHPLAELLGRQLIGIEIVPKKEQTLMVKRAIQTAVKWANKNLVEEG